MVRHRTVAVVLVLAWVLWAEDYISGSWIIAGAGADQAQCEQALRGKLSVPVSAADTSRTWNAVGTRFRATGNYESVRYLCLPDTVDPRPRPTR